MKHLITFYQANTLNMLLSALALCAGLLVVLISLRHFVSAHLRKYDESPFGIHRVIGDIVSATRTLFILSISLLLSVQILDLPDALHSALTQIVIFIVLCQTGIWLNRLIARYLGHQKELRLSQGTSYETTNLNIIAFIVRLFLWGTLLLLALDNFGVNITTLLASLGIGGIAVALAVQNILGDLFASLSIALDKPFMVGDLIEVENQRGTVRHIGLKTTRIQSISGEEVIISNADMLKSRIRNFRQLESRRIVFSVGVVYGTPLAQLENIPHMIRDIVENIAGIRLERVHFKELAASSLNFEVVYYVDHPDYAVYMDAQQKINLELVARFEAEKIEFAFPTQTLILQNAAPPDYPA